MTKTLLITGATGKQGSAVIDALLASNTSDFQIFALTRRPDHPKAMALAIKHPTISLIKGNLEDPETIFTTIGTPIWGVFSLQIPLGDGATPEKEERQAKNLVDVAVKHNVGHFVYTSVHRGPNSHTEATYVPQFASKYRAEKHLRENCGNMTWTILRPTAFMENFQDGFMGKVVSATMQAALPPSAPVQLISTIDIGFFAAESFRRPEEWKGRAISLAGDVLTFPQIKAVYKVKMGKELPQTFWVVGWVLVKLIKELRLTFKFTVECGRSVDIEELKRIHPSLLTFGDWLEMKKGALH